MFSEVRVKTYLGASLDRWKENNLLGESSKGSLTTKKKKEKKRRNLHETSSRGRVYGDFIGISSHKAGKAKMIVTFDCILTFATIDCSVINSPPNGYNDYWLSEILYRSIVVGKKKKENWKKFVERQSGRWR